MNLKNVTIGHGGRRWLIREAVSIEEATHAINMAICTGSVGAKQTRRRGFDGPETIDADVVELNEDGTERQPYGAEASA